MVTQTLNNLAIISVIAVSCLHTILCVDQDPAADGVTGVWKMMEKIVRFCAN